MQKKRFFCQPWVFCFLPEEQKQRVSIRIIETNCDRRLSWQLFFVPCLMFWACGGGNSDSLSWSRTAPFCVLCRSKRAVVNCRNIFWDFLLWFGRWKISSNFFFVYNIIFVAYFFVCSLSNICPYYYFGGGAPLEEIRPSTNVTCSIYVLFPPCSEQTFFKGSARQSLEL